MDNPVTNIFQMKSFKTISILFIIVATVSCSPVKVVTDSNEKVDFSGFKTYNFQSWQDLDKEMFSEADKTLLRESFISEFERRGLKQVNSAGDIQVSIYIVVNSETAFSGYTDYVGGRNGGSSYYGGGWGYGYNGNTSKQQEKLVGTLIMNVYNGSNKKQIWQAIATGAVNENYKTRDKSIPETVSIIMKRFPIRPE
jgi:hypothetical protein